MKVIFLDIDGVLNTLRYIEYQHKHDRINELDAHNNWDPVCMKNLKKLVDETDANIVISSTWRLRKDDNDKDWQTLLINLRQYGLDTRVVGSTPDFSKMNNSYLCRGHEIQGYLDNHPEVEQFVILDDDNDMFHLSNHLVETDFKTGFLAEHLEEAIKILNKEAA